jgi:O-antigen/teichoic acid export membrane protein
MSVAQPTVRGDARHSVTEHELRALARGGLLGIVGLGVNALFGFVFIKIVGSHFAPSSAGAIFMALAVLAMSVSAAPLGADVGLLRYMPIFRHSHRRQEAMLVPAAQLPPLLVTVTATVLLVRFAPELARAAIRHGNRHLLAQELRYLAPFLPVSVLLTTAAAATRAWSVRGAVTVQNVFVPLARCGLLLALFAAGRATPLSVALAWGLPLAFGAAAAVAMLSRHVLADRARAPVEDTTGTRPGRQLVREFWLFSAPRSIQAVFQIAVVYLDVVLVGALASSRAAASYNVASRYVFLGTAVGQGIAFAIGPQLSALLHRRDHTAARSTFRAGAVWMVLLSWPLLLLLAEFAPVFMGVFGEAYRAADGALAIVALAMLVQTGTGNNAVALNMGGKSLANMAIGALAVTVNIGANFLLIPRLGMNGAALAWLLTSVVVQAVTGVVLYRTVGLQPFGRGYRAAALSALACFGVLGALLRVAGGATPVTLLITAALGALIYAPILSHRRRALRLGLLPVIGPRLR